MLEIKEVTDMTTFQGFATLATPKDLLEKLRHDLKRIEAALADPYPAFDFIVTAEHMLDWCYPDSASRKNKKIREQLRMNDALLRVISHLATGIKHFEATASHHQSVSSVRVHKGIFDPKIFPPVFLIPIASQSNSQARMPRRWGPKLPPLSSPAAS
jgi:hypothetical protein